MKLEISQILKAKILAQAVLQACDEALTSEDDINAITLNVETNTARLITTFLGSKLEPKTIEKESKNVENEINIGLNIKNARESKVMKQVELAKMVGTTQSQIAKYERGEQDTTTKRLIKIAEALGVSPESLMKQCSAKKKFLRNM